MARLSRELGVPMCCLKCCRGKHHRMNQLLKFLIHPRCPRRTRRPSPHLLWLEEDRQLQRCLRRNPHPSHPGVIGGGPPDPSGPTPVVFNTPTLPPSGSAPFIPPVVTGGGAPGPGGGNSPVPGPGPDPVPVPEPATVLLLVSGLLGLAGYGRRKFFKK